MEHARRNFQLTGREVEILRLIAHQNLSNKQIARELRLSIHTVKNHVHSIIEKLSAGPQSGRPPCIPTRIVNRSAGLSHA